MSLTVCSQKPAVRSRDFGRTKSFERTAVRQLVKNRTNASVWFLTSCRANLTPTCCTIDATSKPLIKIGTEYFDVGNAFDMYNELVSTVSVCNAMLTTVLHSMLTYTYVIHTPVGI